MVDSDPGRGYEYDRLLLREGFSEVAELGEGVLKNPKSIDPFLSDPIDVDKGWSDGFAEKPATYVRAMYDAAGSLNDVRFGSDLELMAKPIPSGMPCS